MGVGAKPLHALSIGVIPYWNMLPFISELQKNRTTALTVRKGVPTEVNQWLQRGEIHLAPCSSVCLVTNPDHEMALPLGIAANGAVQSVYLGLHAEHKGLFEHIVQRQKELQQLFHEAVRCFGFDARKIAAYVWDQAKHLSNVPLSSCPALKLSGASASGAYLTRLLYSFWFGFESNQLMASRKYLKVYEGQRPIELVIGDEALVRRPQFYKVIDLGSAWKELTGLPFVFAVWQSRGTCLNGWRRQILEIGERAETRMKAEPFGYLPSPAPLDDNHRAISLPDYWKTIRYKLNAEDLKGMLIFLCLVRRLMAPALDSESMTKILRWQEICQNGSVVSV